MRYSVWYGVGHVQGAGWWEFAGCLGIKERLRWEKHKRDGEKQHTTNNDMPHDKNNEEFVDALESLSQVDVPSLVDLFNNYQFFIHTPANAYDSQLDVQRLKDTIINHGGTILDNIPSIDTISNAFIICPFNSLNQPTLSPTFIKECISSNKLLDFNDYLIPYSNTNTSTNDPLKHGLVTISDKVSNQIPTDSVYGTNRIMISNPQSSNNNSDTNTNSTNTHHTNTHHTKASFTFDEDERILDFVRKNPTRRTTHTLFDEIARYMENHTGNSIRHRYRVYLSKRLNFVYKLNENGELLTDSNGNYIKTNELPPSLKRKFTADEDYSLAMALKNQFYKDIYKIDPNDINTTEENIPSFNDYLVNDKKGPVAREFFKKFSQLNNNHTENAWRDRFRKFLIPYGIDNYINYYQNETNLGNIPEPMKNLTNRSSTTNSNSNSRKRQKVSASNPTTTTTTTNNDELTLDPATIDFISSLSNRIEEEEHEAKMTERNTFYENRYEYSEDVAKAIRRDFNTENEDIQIHKVDVDSIQFPPTIATNDLFSPTFFNFNSTIAFFRALFTVTKRDYQREEANKLVEDLYKEVGIRMDLSSYILTRISGDLMMFERYFLFMFKDNLNPPDNIPGIWTIADDEKLKSGDPEKVYQVIEKHGESRVELRKNFFDSNLL